MPDPSGPVPPRPYAAVRTPVLPALATLAILAALVVGVSLLVAAPARAAGPGPGPVSDQTSSAAATHGTASSGPRLRVGPRALDRSLTCDGGRGATGKRPVLLVPGTTLTPEVNFSWNYERVFSAQGRPWCAVTLPHLATGDIQVAAEYVTHAIRTMHRRADRPISVVGFSQGGMVPRWSLKYWPDTRAMVDDLVGLAPSNHGTVLADLACARSCQPALRQQSDRSRFITTLNTGPETWRGISYSTVWSATDEVVQPNVPGVPGAPPSSALRTGPGARSNTPVQSVCPVSVADHLAVGSSNPVAYAVVQDALSHRGPAKAARISRSVCLQPFFPGIDPVTFPARSAGLGIAAAQAVASQPRTTTEPRLRGYAR